MYFSFYRIYMYLYIYILYILIPGCINPGTRLACDPYIHRYTKLSFVLNPIINHMTRPQFVRLPPNESWWRRESMKSAKGSKGKSPEPKSKAKAKAKAKATNHPMGNTRNTKMQNIQNL